MFLDGNRLCCFSFTCVTLGYLRNWNDVQSLNHSHENRYSSKSRDLQPLNSCKDVGVKEEVSIDFGRPSTACSTKFTMEVAESMDVVVQLIPVTTVKEGQEFFEFNMHNFNELMVILKIH